MTISNNETNASRRGVLAASIGIAAASAVLADTVSASAAPAAVGAKTSSSVITVSDGAQIYYKDWGTGQPIVFSHGWPLSADAFEDQMFFLASTAIAVSRHDRRGHGRSSQTWNGNDLDTYADDLSELVDALDLKHAVHVGHSTGGGEVARYIGRHGTKRVAKAVLIGAIPPVMLKTGDQSRKARRSKRSMVFVPACSRIARQFWKDLSMPFYGYNRPGAKVSEGVRESFWLQSMMAGMPASYFCIKAFSETDLTEDLKKFDVPTLILHGDDDQIVPYQGRRVASVKDREECEAQSLSGCAAWAVHDPEGQGERRSSGVHQGLKNANAAHSSDVARDGPVVRRHAVGQIEHHFIDIAPAPAFRRIVAFDDRMLAPWKCLVACLCGELSQQPTWPQVRQRRRCTQGEPIFKHSSQPSALGVTVVDAVQMRAILRH